MPVAEASTLDPLPPVDDLFADATHGERTAIASPQQSREPAALADAVVWLERNYRFGLESPIGQLSLAIRRGDPQAALATLTPDPGGPCAAALYEDPGPAPGDRTIARLANGFALYAEALSVALASAIPEPAPLFDALNRFRVLCATRSGLRGVDQINKVIRVDQQPLGQTPTSNPSQGT